MASKEQIGQYNDQGYFITDDAVDAEMLLPLTDATRRVADKVRSGEVVDNTDRIATGGAGKTPIVIMGVMAPEFDEPVFAEYLASAPVERYGKAFLGAELRLGWVTLFAIKGSDYQCGWHRDFGAEERDGSYEVEMEILGRYRKNLLKWHTALVDDPCLWIVPGSQRRYRTDYEREVLISNKGVGDIPGAEQIKLKRGQTIFWNGNSIHRGVMPAEMEERLTLCGCLVKHQADDPPEPLDERFRWRLADNVRAALPEKIQRYYDRWKRLQIVEGLPSGSVLPPIRDE